MKPITLKCLLPFLLLLFTPKVNAQIITTYAGTGIAGYSGDGGSATEGQLFSPYGLAVDDSGNLYIAEKINNIIRKVSAAGIISTYAGTGVAGFSGDGGPATLATLNTPWGVACDRHGNVFFTDNVNNKIRKISSTGIITSLALTVHGECPPMPMSGLVTNVANPTGIAIDDSDYIYFSNTDYRIVMRVNHSNYAINWAGNCHPSYLGDGGPATHGALNMPMGVACDHLGNVFIGDDGNNVVRKVSASKIITTFAGNGFSGAFYGDGGSANLAGLFGPFGVTTDFANNVYIQDLYNRRIRKVDNAGIITTVAGNGVAAYTGDNGPATDASFYDATGFAVDLHGNYYISDLWYSVIRKVTFLPTTMVPTNSVHNDLLLYPNPCRGAFSLFGTVPVNEGGTLTLEITDILGQVVYKNTMPAQQGNISAKIDLGTGIGNGVYLLHILGGDQNEVTRFVVEK